MSELEIYEVFIDWLGKTWWELPKSEHLLPMIKARYTAEEARFLTGFPFSGRSLEELAELKSMAPDQLGPYLDELVRKGLLFKKEADNTFRYSLNDSYFVFFRSAFWPGNDDEASQQTAVHTNKYYFDGFYDQFLDPSRCLGCGVCVHKCPTDSLTLEPTEEIQDPPATMREYGMRFLADRKAGVPLKRKRS